SGWLIDQLRCYLGDCGPAVLPTAATRPLVHFESSSILYRFSSDGGNSSCNQSVPIEPAGRICAASSVDNAAALKLLVSNLGVGMTTDDNPDKAAEEAIDLSAPLNR